MIVHNLEQGSFEWHELRLGKVTGTSLKDVVGANNLSVIDEMIAEMETGYSDDSGFINDAMQRGIDLEPFAVKDYIEKTGIEMIKHGFLQSSEMLLLGYSPDGLTDDKKGGLEVKCPSTKKHVQYIRQNQLPNDYKWQIICAFIVNPNLEWMDFVSYDPRFTKKPLFIHRTHRSDVQDVINSTITTLTKFFTKFEQIKSEVLF